MHASNLSYRVWWLAIYQLVTNLKGVSSMKLHRDLGISQRAAWHLAHKIRRAWAVGAAGGKANFIGPVEVDETFVGGRQRSRHSKQRRYWRERANEVDANGVTHYWGSMVAVAGVKDRRTNRISAAVIPNIERHTLHDFITERTDRSAMVYTDDAIAYRRLPRRREAVNHSAGEYVRGEVGTQGIESFWAMLKRGYKGTYYWWSEKHLHRYLAEFAGRHNNRPVDTEEQMRRMVRNMHRRHLSYARLVAGQ
ncbi:MAG: IS1595 family transposase [Chloroflexi bacterium]|nr:IS1595 family transposase [Chloroflexota bacterium]